jgi:ribosome biogenesis GTPase / thiamine phosphate phosphatase
MNSDTPQTITVKTDHRGRVVRLDRGWSSVEYDDGVVVRVRNMGVEVAVGDYILVSDDGERVDEVLPRRSALIRRASFEGARAMHDIVAANIDTVFLLHAVTSPPNQRRLERELVLSFDSGAQPVIILTKIDMVSTDEVDAVLSSLRDVAVGVSIHSLSAVTGEGTDAIRSYTRQGQTVAFLGASGVGKSTLVNQLVGRDLQRTADVREGDQRGRHTTVAAELLRIPDGGWLIDTPGLRALSLWTSGTGIERAFRDIFDVTDHCKFRDCKHRDEPECAVQAAIAAGTIAVERLDAMRRLVQEEAALEDEQREHERSQDRRRRPADTGLGTDAQ